MPIEAEPAAPVSGRGPKAVIIPDLDQLPDGAAARHELAGLVELLAGYPNRGGVRHDRRARQLRPRCPRRLLRRPVVGRFHFLPLTSYLGRA